MAYKLNEQEHKYPSQIHLFDDLLLNSLVTQISSKHMTQPMFNDLLRTAYAYMFTQILNHCWPRQKVEVETPLTDDNPGSRLVSEVFESGQKAVCVDIARAGMLPSQILFDLLTRLVAPENIRQDHIYASRQTDENHKVTHTELAMSKIGGTVAERFVFLPDPMGATGHSLSRVLRHYKNEVDGEAKAYISVHLIITPEFIRHMTETHPDTIIYAARLDRGLSAQKVLSSTPGSYWEQEKGLNETHYIVPGAGGVGEIINNSYV